MNLGKIGDQNVEFFKGHLFDFSAIKLAKPIKSYGQSKIGKGKISDCAKSLERYLFQSASRGTMNYFSGKWRPKFS